MALTGERLGQRGASLRPGAPSLPFRVAFFAPRIATVCVREPPDPFLRQPLLETVARVNGRELSRKLAKCALSHGASPFDAKNPVLTAVRQLLEEGTTPMNRVSTGNMLSTPGSR
jgi:hypothetical protein